jgi:hypothetical protein
MAYDTRPIDPSVTSEPAGYENFGLKAGGGERIVTTIAITVAILIVAFIAVLMGMA